LDSPAANLKIGEEGTEIALFFSGRNHAGENLDTLQANRDTDQGIPIQISGKQHPVPEKHDAGSDDQFLIPESSIRYIIHHRNKGSVQIRA